MNKILATDAFIVYSVLAGIRGSGVFHFGQCFAGCFAGLHRDLIAAWGIDLP